MHGSKLVHGAWIALLLFSISLMVGVVVLLLRRYGWMK
jgi:hypothetical protein